MANFWDLPKPVRETIYRLHLVMDGPLSEDAHDDHVILDPRAVEYPRRFMPAICLVSSKMEKEAAPVYYGENHFVFGRTKTGEGSNIFGFTACTWTRHLRLIRKVTYQWPKPQQWYGSNTGMAGESFTEISRFKSLQELYVRVDEEAMVRKMLGSRRTLQVAPTRPLTPQDNVAVLRHPGMTGLLKISGVPHVEFLKWITTGRLEVGGAIPGGFLESEILPKLKASKRRATTKRKQSFDFLSLPPELRNHIYGLLLIFEGPVHPSTQPPSSVPKGRSSTARRPTPGSALNILAVNRQIHDEAYGIFYDANVLEFYYPIQLQAFAVGLGQKRLSAVKQVTIHYHNRKSGGVDLADMSFQMLRRFSGLRRLHVLFVNGGLTKRLHMPHTASSYTLSYANPFDLVGMKTLFDLRGISDIVVQDIDFEEEVGKIKKDKRYPDGFQARSREGVYLGFERVLNHLNLALTAAQDGKHNRELLEDQTWHTRDEFPPARVEIEEVAEVVKDETAEKTRSFPEREMVDLTEDEIVVSSKRGGSTRYGLRRRTEEMEAPAEEDEADEMEAHATSETAQGASDDQADEMEDQPADETEQRAELQEADEMEADGTTAKGGEDEIIVTHVGRVKHPQAGGSRSVTSEVRLGGLDGASDEIGSPGNDQMENDEMEEDSVMDEEDSYFAREPSVEL